MFYWFCKMYNKDIRGESMKRAAAVVRGEYRREDMDLCRSPVSF